ncbi:MAG: DMT family transporter [Clostridia bacterium]
MNQDNKPKAIMFMLLSALAFTIMQAIIKSTTGIPVLQKVFFRNLIGLVFTLFLIYKNNLSLFGKKENRKLLFLRGTLGVLGIITYFYSIEHLPMADASIISKTNPFFVTLFAWLFLKEKLSKAQIPVLLTAFVGAMLVIRPQFSADVIPALVGFAGAIFAGGAYTVLRLLKGKENTTTIVFYFCFFSTIATFPFVITSFVIPNLTQWILLISIGLMALIGQYSITLAYSYAPAAEVSIFNYSSIIIATILGFILWSEVPDVMSFTGGLLIIIAGIFSWWYNKKADRRVPKVPIQ